MVPQLSLLVLPRLDLLLQFIIVKVVFLRVVDVFIEMVLLLRILHYQSEVGSVYLKLSTAIFERILNASDRVLLCR